MGAPAQAVETKRSTPKKPRLRVLVLDEELPWPLDSGKRIRTFNLLSRLASHHEITLLTHRPAEGLGAPRAELAARGMHTLESPSRIPPKSGLRFYLRLLANLFSPWPYIVTSHFSRAMHRQTWEQASQVDVLHCEWTPYAAFVRGLECVPRVLCAHNLESDIWEGYFETEANPLRKAYIYLQWKKVKRFERTVFPLFDGIIAVSEYDRARIEELGGRNVFLVENGVDTAHFRPQPEPAGAPSLLFCGSLDWRPNQDAVCFFLDRIFPAVRGAIPNCTVRIVGRRPPQDLIQRAESSPGVEMVGQVEDVRPYAGAAHVVVVPLRTGGGTRLKILEAWAMERAVVSTTMGAAGLPARTEENLLLADEPGDFARAVVHLLRDPGRRRSLAQAGRAIVLRRFDWRLLEQRQSRFWTEVHRNFTLRRVYGGTEHNA